MKLHILKIKDKYYQDLIRGRKSFELCKNDRDYKVGDLIHFVGINGEEYNYNVYIIVYVLKDVPEYGLDKDYCILGIRNLINNINNSN